MPLDNLPDLAQGIKKLRVSCDKGRVEVLWTPAQNLHVTLHFFGETPRDKIPLIARQVQHVAATHAPFSLALTGVGAFPDVVHSRVLWSGVQNKRALQSLQQELVASLSTIGYTTEDLPYQPHLTLGRIRKTKSVRDTISPFVRKKWGTVTVDQIVLYESRQQGPHSVYTALMSFPLMSQQLSGAAHDENTLSK